MAPHRIKLFENSFLKQHLVEIALTVVGLLLLAVGAGGTYFLLNSFSDRFYPGTVIDSHQVTGLKPDEVLALLRQSSVPPEFQIMLAAENVVIASSSAELGLHQDTQTTVETAYAFDQAQPLSVKLGRVLGLLPAPQPVTSSWRYNSPAVMQALETLQTQFSTLPVAPRADLATTGKSASLTINPGKAGKTLNLEQALALVQAAADPTATPDHRHNLDSAITISNPELTENQMSAARERAAHLVGKSLIFSGDDQRLTLNDQKLISFLALPSGFNLETITAHLDKWQTSVSRPPQDAQFEYDPQTLVVSTFTPPHNGLHLDQAATQKIILDTLAAIESQTSDQKVWEATLPLAITPPP